MESWGILEIKGHRVYAGRISEATIAGAGFIRVDVPDMEGQSAFSKYFPPSSVHCFTPTDEATAQQYARLNREHPVDGVAAVSRPALRESTDEEFFDREDEDDPDNYDDEPAV